jgi:hypothetical protein
VLILDVRRVNANTIAFIAGSMTSGLKGIRPAVSLGQQARIAGLRSKKLCGPGGSGLSKGSCGYSSRQSFVVKKPF